MAYRADPGLDFLGTLSSKELDDLTRIITHDKDGKTRYTEQLTSNEKYKRYYPDHRQYWKEIAEEIQLFGGNTFVNFLFRRGRGVEYKEILCDVCDKMKVKYDKYWSIERIEDSLLMKILEKALEDMPKEELEKLGHELGVDTTLTAGSMAAIFQAIFRAGGFKSYQLTLIIVNAVLRAITGRGLALAANVGLVRLASVLTGPIGWAVTAIWTAFDIAGAAYRVTIPAVIQVAYLRKLSENRNAINLANNIQL